MNCQHEESERTMNATTPSITPEGRTAGNGTKALSKPVTLMNSFEVPEGRDEAFLELWTETSHYFRAQPGFLSLRLHRAVTPGAECRYVNVARWASDAAYRAPHNAAEFFQLVGQDAWREFPSRPALYEVLVAAGDDLPAR